MDVEPVFWALAAAHFGPLRHRKTALVYCPPFFRRPCPPQLMSQLAEFVTRHPIMVSVAVALAAAAVTIEIRHRARGATSVGPNDAVRLINAGAVVLDVRKNEEFAVGHIIDAKNFPHADLAQQADALKKFREKPVIVYCESGVTAGAAVNALKAQGFTKVANLRGGLNAWRQENLPVVADTAKKKAGKAA
jgi:rhodanese-related sulfurtransferase